MAMTDAAKNLKSHLYGKNHAKEQGDELMSHLEDVRHYS